jgi:hypothetical protein
MSMGGAIRPVETHPVVYSRWWGDDAVDDAFATAALRLKPGAPAEVGSDLIRDLFDDRD